MELLRSVGSGDSTCTLGVDGGSYVFVGPSGHLRMARGPGDIQENSLTAYWEAFLQSQGYRVLSQGDGIEVSANNGSRHGTVLAVIGDRALLEYSMPCGSTSLRIVDKFCLLGPITSGRSVSYWSVPRKWMTLMVEIGACWTGTPQQSPAALRPAEMLVWRTVRAKLGFGHTVVRPISSREAGSGLSIVFHEPTLSSGVLRHRKLLSSCGFELAENRGGGWKRYRYVGEEDR